MCGEVLFLLLWSRCCFVFQCTPPSRFVSLYHTHNYHACMYLPRLQSTGNSCRWHFTYDVLAWFGKNQRAIQLFDTRYAARGGEAYGRHQLGLDDWDLLHESAGVMQPMTVLVAMMEVTLKPTAGEVLPNIGRVRKYVNVRCSSSGLVVHFRSGRRTARSLSSIIAHALNFGIASSIGDMHDGRVEGGRRPGEEGQGA